MRVIGSVEIGGENYQAIWAALPWINGELDASHSGKALTIRNSAAENLAIIGRNAKLAEVEKALATLRRLGIRDAHLHRLLNYKGSSSGLAQHVKMLVSNMN